MNLKVHKIDNSIASGENVLSRSPSLEILYQI